LQEYLNLNTQFLL